MAENIEQKLDKILQAITGLEARITRIETGGGNTKPKGTASASSKKLSIKEFLLEKPPSTDIQRTLAIGYFLENQMGMTCFTKAELEKGYSDAKEPTPSNISVNINHCIKHGHLMETEEQKNNKTAYTVTRSGEQFVEAGYPKSSGRK